MILAKRITKLANDIKCHEKVTKQVMKQIVSALQSRTPENNEKILNILEVENEYL